MYARRLSGDVARVVEQRRKSAGECCRTSSPAARRSTGSAFSTLPASLAARSSTAALVGSSTQSSRRSTRQRQDHPPVLGLLVVAAQQVGDRPDERDLVAETLDASDPATCPVTQAISSLLPCPTWSGSSSLQPPDGTPSLELVSTRVVNETGHWQRNRAGRRSVQASMPRGLQGPMSITRAEFAKPSLDSYAATAFDTSSTARCLDQPLRRAPRGRQCRVRRRCPDRPR